MKKIFLSLMVFFLVLQIVSATDTNIIVKTIPYHTVQLTTFDPSSTSFLAFERFEGISDKYGDISFTSSSDENSFNIIAFIKKYGEKVATKKFSKSFQAGEEVYLEIIPTGYELIPTPANETISETNISKNETGTTPQEAPSIENKNKTTEETIIEEKSIETIGKTKTGFVSLGEKGILSPKIITYIIVTFLILAISLFGIIQIKKISIDKTPKEIVVKKLSEIEKEKNNEKPKTSQERLEEAEKKIQEAQEEIKRIKNQSNMKEERIKKAKEKLIEDQKELMRLRNEKD